MVSFPGLLQFRLFNDLCPDFGTIRGLVFLIEFRTILWFVMEFGAHIFVCFPTFVKN